jgi:mRNA interferase MazF
LFKRGDIHWVRLDPIEGSEIGKTRPAVIVSNDINNQIADTVTIVPITTSTKKIYPFEVFCPKGAGGLKEDSKAKANQLRTIDRSRIDTHIGTLSQELMDKVGQAIKIHLSLS